MNRAFDWRRAAGLAALVAVTACGTAAGQSRPAPSPPPASVPAEASPPAAPAPADTGRQADVRFLHGMIAHHQQALEMTRLVPGRAARADVRLLAERIEVSQIDEIARMQRWLRSRGESVPGEHARHEGHAMPGMATPEEMARLAAASGAAFDRMFLELMIRHHEGALVMVAELFAAPGGGEEGEIFQLASDVDADQRAEIARMRRLLDAPPPGGGPR